MARLIISSPDGRNGILELNKSVITVGRGNANDLVLNDSSVSRFHAVIKVQDNSIRIADRGSTNGIRLNGQKIIRETELKNGDVAVVGRYELRLESVDENAIQVRRAQWPSTLNHIMRGRAQQPSMLRTGEMPAEQPGVGHADLVSRIKKLEQSPSEQELEIRKKLKLLRPGETSFILPDQPKQDGAQSAPPPAESK